MKVTVEFDAPENTSHREIQFLLMDALYEFRMSRGRGNPDTYVRERYKNMNWDVERINEKILEVNNRMTISAMMHSSINIK